ncbi:hypothetical protein D4R75_13290 [bacterium]|nr:MAG: hypothetical protein D4R75_13290 [bacterium]
MPKILEHETTLDYVSPDLLDFDPTNPRFAGLLVSSKQENIQKELFREPYFASELVDSFLANGFIDYEPLVVKRNGGRLMVIEGNRRLAAIREIRANPDKYKGRVSDLEKIPVLVFPERPDEQQQNEMRVYLGVRHMLGFRDWPPISKAQWLDRASRLPGGLDKVIKETQMKKGDARRFLVPYRLLKDADVPMTAGADFWMLAEALSRTGIKKFLQLDVDSNTLEIKGCDKKNLSLLLADIYGPKMRDGARDASKRIVDDTRDLSTLGKVLSSERATAALRSGRTLEEAEIYVDSRQESIDRLFKMTKNMGVLIKKLFKGSRDEESTRLLEFFKKFDGAVKKFVGKVQ